MSSWIPTPAAILVRLAAIIFLHAAYSAWEARVAAKAGSYTIPTTLGSPVPFDILAQAFVGFFLLVTGTIWSTTKLKEISWSSEMKKRSIDSEDSRSSFVNLRHRGTLLFAEVK